MKSDFNLIRSIIKIFPQKVNLVLELIHQKLSLKYNSEK